MDKRTNFFVFGAITILWVTGIIIINPSGNFPFDDDWAYARVVQSLTQIGRLQYPGEVAIPLISQALWGTLFSKIFGFSFVTLRISTLILGLAGVLITYFLFKRISKSTIIAVFAAALVAVNPMYLSLSFSFMSDIFFYVFTLASVYFFIETIETDSTLSLILGTLFALTATLCRQVGVIIPLAFGIVYLLKNKQTSNMSSRVKPLLAILFVVGPLVGFQTWLQGTGKLPAAYSCHINNLIAAPSLYRNIMSFIYLVTDNFLYLGLFLFPFFMVIAPSFWSMLDHKKKTVVSSGFIIISFLLAMFLFFSSPGSRAIPFIGNTLMVFGIGPVLLPESVQLIPMSKAVRLILTIGGILGESFLFCSLCLSLEIIQRKYFQKWQVYFLTLLAIFYLTLISLTSGADRYQLILLGLLPAIVMGAMAKKNINTRSFSFRMGALLLGLYGWFSISAVHDCLSWHRAQWKAISYLVDDLHVPPQHICMGQEANAWFSYPLTSNFISNKSWWWTDKLTDQYDVAFAPSQGYRIIRLYPYSRWLPLGGNRILVLERDSRKSKN